MVRNSPIKYSFNAGELSDLIDGRVDQPKHGNGVKVARNFLATVQGPAFRRGGTYFIRETKDSADRSWLVDFQFNVFQSYVLEFGDQYIRFYTSHAQVLSGMSAYEIATPYLVADLTAADGTFALTLEQSNDVVYIAHNSGTYPLQKLTRIANTNWTLSEVELEAGPFQERNITQSDTVYADAATGSVTLTASNPIFNSDMVGSIFYIEMEEDGSIPPWEVGKSITSGDLRRSDGKTYIAQNTATTGSSKPIHTDGTVIDGDSGVEWLYSDPGYGWAKITAFTSDTEVTATVQSRLPDNVVGSGNATYRWAKALYSDDNGHPEMVGFFRERLVLTKGTQIDMSVSADFENFSKREFGTITPANALSIKVTGSQQNKIIGMAEAGELIILTAGSEHTVAEITTADPLGPGNIQVKNQTKYGARGIRPIILGDSVIFAQTSGRKLRDIAYSLEANKYKGKDLTILSEHLTKGGIVSMAYQQEPYSIIWAATARGKLLSFTYNKEQDVVAWMPHPIGGNGFVESVICIPAPDNKRDELWLIVRRTINGQTKRYVEYMTPEFDSTEQRQQDCFYVDSGLSLYNTINATLTVPSGALTKGATGITFTAGSAIFSAGDIGREIHFDYVVPTLIDFDWVDVPAKAIAYITDCPDTTHAECTIRKAFPEATTISANGWRKTVSGLTGLDHLEGETVDLLIDGAAHTQMVVSSGAVGPFNYQGSVVHVGEPAPCKIKTMRTEVATAAGTSQGKMKRANRVTTRFKDTLGGRLGPRDNNLSPLIFRDASVPMNEPPPLFNGDKKVTMPEGHDTDGYIIYENTQPYPATLICMIPEIQVQL